MTLVVKMKPMPKARGAKPPAPPEWKAGDWVTFDLDIGQIKEIRDQTSVSFSNGFCETSGNLFDRFRPLTLQSKSIVETFDTYYKRLKEIDGNAGFNYPDIHSYFSALALRAIDHADDFEHDAPYRKAQEFVAAARGYIPRIDGIRLFRPR